MSTDQVPLTPRVVGWALDQSGLTLSDVAHRVGVSPEDLVAWRSGSSFPSRGQFRRLAETLRRPTALFFLEKPPTDGTTQVSLRAAFGDLKRDLTPEERNLIRFAQGLQTIVQWSSPATAADLPSATFDDPPDEVSERFRTRLGIKPHQQRSWRDAGLAFEKWRDALETQGVVVVQLAMGKMAVRGFSLTSKTVPLAAVNTSYSYQVRIFSLFHEIAHLLTDSSSACIGFAAPARNVNRVERWCERFAASFLLPAASVEAFMSQLHPKHDPLGLDEVRALSRAFHVSARAAAIRLIDLRFAESGLYPAVDAHWQPQERDDRRGGHAPLTPMKRLRQVGRRVASQIRQAVNTGNISTLDALRYLDLTLGEYDDFSELATADL